MDRAGLAMGIVAMLVGVGIGGLMLAFPGNTNSAYPTGIALLAPLAFILAGLLICAHALGRIALVGIAFKALGLCLLVLVNWGAFFSDTIQCQETVSFLGFEIVERYPSETECRGSLRVILMSLDMVVAAIVAVVVWRTLASRRRESAK